MESRRCISTVKGAKRAKVKKDQIFRNNFRLVPNRFIVIDFSHDVKFLVVRKKREKKFQQTLFRQCNVINHNRYASISNQLFTCATSIFYHYAVRDISTV